MAIRVILIVILSEAKNLVDISSISPVIARLDRAIQILDHPVKPYDDKGRPLSYFISSGLAILPAIALAAAIAGFDR